MQRIEHIFFDLDRTLWDFEQNSKQALQFIFAELKLDQFISSFEDFHLVYREINASYWDLYAKGLLPKDKLRSVRFVDSLEKFGVLDSQIGIKMGEMYVKISPYQTRLFPETKETLEQLKREDKKLHIITNGFKEVQFIKLKNSDILHYFDDVLCSEEVGKNKPDPLIFNAALNRNKASANHSIMIGDDFHADVLGAEKAGIRGVLFDPHNHFKARNEIERIQKISEISRLIIGL